MTNYPPPPHVSKLTAKLKMRGIYEQAKELGWCEHKIFNNEGWLYPLWTEAGSEPAMFQGKPIQRWKNYDSAPQGGFKCMWCYDGAPKPSGNTELNDAAPTIYVPPGTDAAFVSTACAETEYHCVLHIVSGEPDVLTMRAAGFQAVVCFFGEKFIPPDLKARLAKAVGIGPGDVVKLYPDLDEAGLTWAQEIARSLAPHGIAVEAYRLPDRLGAKGDLNKLWIDVKFDADKFKAELASCAALTEDKLAPPKKSPARVTSGPATFLAETRNSGVYGRIADALDVTHFNADGRSRNIKCPFHDDSKPSAVWWDNGHDEPNLMCFVCGWHGAKETMDRLGIDNPAATLAATRSPAPSRATIAVPVNEAIVRKAINLFEKDIAGASYLTMPFKTIAALGGFCKTLELGKMMAIIGVSGGQKTTFLENVYWRLAQDGHPGALYSPEWNGLDTLLRHVQRLGGPTYERAKQHIAYNFEMKNGRGVDWCYDKGMLPFTVEEQDKFDVLMKRIKSTPGQIYEIPHAYSFEDTKQEFECAAQTARDKGAPLRWIVVDYIQLLAHEYGEVMDAIAWLKDFCMVNNCFGLIASQMVKSVSAEVRKGNIPNGGEGMEYAKDNAFNSGLVLSANYDDDGNIQPWLNVSVVKNSLGRARQIVRLAYVPGRLYLSDPDEAMFKVPVTPRAVASSATLITSVLDGPQ